MKLDLDCEKFKMKNKDGVITVCQCNKSNKKFKRDIKFIDAFLNRKK
jgi:hypothetical protein